MAAFGSRNSSIEPDVDAAMDFKPDSGSDPLIRLWATVMHRGVRDFEKACRDKYPDTHPWVFWFWSDDTHPGSFVWLCELFNWCPAQARKRALDNINNGISREGKDSEIQ